MGTVITSGRQQCSSFGEVMAWGLRAQWSSWEEARDQPHARAGTGPPPALLQLRPGLLCHE